MLAHIAMNFSVIIASKRGCSSFRLSLESSIRQTLKPKQILVVDDCSGEAEEKKKILEDSGISYQFLVNPKCLGFAASRNKAIEIATGDWIAILDDDDTWCDRYLEISAIHLAATNCSWSFCIPDSISYASTYAVSREIPQELHRLLYSGIGRGSGLIFSREAILAVGGFSSAYRVVADRDLMLRLLLAEYKPIEIVGLPIFTNETGGVTCDRELWLAEAIQLLEDFFTMPGSELYLAEKSNAKKVWQARLAPVQI